MLLRLSRYSARDKVRSVPDFFLLKQLVREFQSLAKGGKIELSTRTTRKWLAVQWPVFKKRWSTKAKKNAMPIGSELLSHFEFVNGEWLIPRTDILRTAKRLRAYAPTRSRVSSSKLHDECLRQLIDHLQIQRDLRFFSLNPKLKPAPPSTPDLGDKYEGVRQLDDDELCKFAFLIWCALKLYLRSDINKETLFASKSNRTPFLWQAVEPMIRERLSFIGAGSKYGIIQRTIMNKDRWREPIRDTITNMSSYSEDEITRLAVICLKDVQKTVFSYMIAKSKGLSLDSWLRERGN